MVSQETLGKDEKWPLNAQAPILFYGCITAATLSSVSSASILPPWFFIMQPTL